VVKEALKALEDAYPEFNLVEIVASPCNFWCKDAGYHFDYYISIVKTEGGLRITTTATGYHCAPAMGVERESIEEAIEGMLSHILSYNWNWSIRYRLNRID